MAITLNTLISQVYPTFRKDSQTESGAWSGGIDLNNDGTVQPDEEIKDTNDQGTDMMIEIDDRDIIYFFQGNIAKILEDKDKTKELVFTLLAFIQQNPYCSDEDSASAQEVLSIIISNASEPEATEYLRQIDNLLASSNFLVRWVAVDILAISNNPDVSIIESIKKSLTDLQQRETQRLGCEKPKTTITDYQFDNLYAEYLGSIRDALKIYQK
jgi:hypothetical protein